MKKKLRLMMTMLLLAVMGSAWAEDAYYTLTPVAGSNSNYAGNCDVMIDGITWNLTGNSQLIPWRIGGKSITNAARTVYSKTAMGSVINKVELTVGAASSITVNSLKLTVASDASFSNIIDEVSASFVANSIITFVPHTDKNWSAGSYYKFIFNVTVSGTSNKFVEFSKAEFYSSNNVSPIINAENVALTYDATSGEIPYTITNPIDGKILSASSTDDWISNIDVAADKVTFSTTQNEGSEDRIGTITLSYDEATDKVITVTQGHLVIDYATLPFTYDGNGTQLPTGLTQNGLGTYSTSPAMKFDNTNDYLILKFNEAPGILTFDIKGNSFSGGTFKVQTSTDGVTYTDLETYTSLGDTQSEEFNLAADVRYIKWVYTKKVSGNVALGNIRLDKVLLLSYPQDSYTANLYDGFEAPLLSNPYNLSPITYSSSNESVAKVKVDGSVVLFGVGTTEITASFAGNDEHEAGTATYTLTVSKHSGSTIYKKVNSTSDLVAGKKYIIVCEEHQVGMGGHGTSSTGTLANYRVGVSGLVISNNTVNISGLGVVELILGGDAQNGYTFKATDENNYLGYSGSSNELLFIEENDLDDAALWSVGMSTKEGWTNEGYVLLSNKDSERELMYNSTGTSNRFVCYKGTQNVAVLYVQESGVEYEEVTLANNDGYRTYVTENNIDWAQTLERNEEKDLDVHGYRISQFSKATVTLTELSGITVAGTPIVLKGKMGVNCLVIADASTEATETGTNLLQAGPVDENLTEESSLIYVLQKTPSWTESTTYEQYKFYPLKFTRWKDIRSDQAYLVLQKESEGIGSNDANDPGMSGGPNPSSIGMRFIHAYDDEPMVSDDAGLVDRINDIQRNATLDGEFYSISGVRIAAPTKGLYIVNGKKVLVK